MKKFLKGCDFVFEDCCEIFFDDEKNSLMKNDLWVKKVVGCNGSVHFQVICPFSSTREIEHTYEVFLYPDLKACFVHNERLKTSGLCAKDLCEVVKFSTRKCRFIGNDELIMEYVEAEECFKYLSFYLENSTRSLNIDHSSFSGDNARSKILQWLHMNQSDLYEEIAKKIGLNKMSFSNREDCMGLDMLDFVRKWPVLCEKDVMEVDFEEGELSI